ncbi:ABC transporter ATP-binding protein [Candidatus Dojkabacteria bacterium]|uniref:ABC transporter ATP-binding protein n=1 Tax=Candidatus Dojkabacteria bacterium TaxID=2099670 RepID=A0A847ETF7_9BACT|nr:ABC transporter ATP-binding protein [Candidatus Dojkabacteria bacterium]
MEKKKVLSLKDYFKISMWSLKINWDISKFISITTLVTSIYSNLSGIFYSLVIAKIIDSLIQLSQSGNTEIKSVLSLVILFAIIELLSIITDSVDRYSRRYKRRLVRSYLSRIEYQKINELGIQTIQLPEVANKIQKTSDWIWSVTDVSDTVVSLMSSFIRSVVAGVIIFRFSPIITLGILFVSAISYIQKKTYLQKDFDWQTSDKNMEESKKAWWIQRSLTNPEEIDEIGLVGSFKFLDKKFNDFYNYFNKGFEKILRAESITGFFIEIGNLGVIVGGSIKIFTMVLNKDISIGNTTFYLGTVKSFYGGISNFLSNLVWFRDLVMKEKEVYDFFELQSLVSDGHIKLERLLTPPSIEVKNISFHYPNAKRNIFKNFSLKINSGDKVAIVGENGAGKSTLVKLLCRLYDPQKGEILVNGKPLKALSLNDWYKNVGVLFQDYNFYGNLSVEENIYIGKSIKKINKKNIIKASQNADAHSFVLKYPLKYQTLMSERLKEGIKPSKGQQQKIAIARFFYRDAPFAIFDEPTSAIDSDSEFKIFNRIYNFFNNKTVVIISHRFSTVRKADKIFVIKEGKIVEQGNHKELMEKKGLYFNNFNKQAQGYNSD